MNETASDTEGITLNYYPTVVPSLVPGTGTGFATSVPLPIGIWTWNPQTDITVYELACAMPILIGRLYNCGVIETLYPQVQRHFRKM